MHFSKHIIKQHMTGYALVESPFLEYGLGVLISFQQKELNKSDVITLLRLDF
jgi:hypothetical protein